MAATTSTSFLGSSGLDSGGTPPGRPVRFVAVRAQLLPAEIVTARSADRMRLRVIGGLAALVAVLMLGYGLSWWQTHSADNDLAALQQRGDALNAQTQRFGPLVSAQARTASIHSQLGQLMTGDLSWRTMLTTLRAQAPSGTTLTNVTGAITAGAGGTGSGTDGGYSPLNQSGEQQVGTLTITGIARDKSAVAAYADDLAKVKGLAAPTPTSVTSGTGTAPGAGHGVTFSISAIITSRALGGRYSDAAPTTSTASPTTGTTTGGN